MRRRINRMISKTKKNIVAPLLLFLLILILFSCVFAGKKVISSSMEPALNKGSLILINRLAYKKREVKRGDIILFREDGVDAVKRVIALPGEKVRFQDGFVIIDDRLYAEEYLSDLVETNSNETFKVPKGCFFVLGDNREHSYDSRFSAEPYVKMSQIKGKVIAAFGKGSTGPIPSVETTE